MSYPAWRVVTRDGYRFHLPESVVDCYRLGSSPSLAQYEDVERALVVSTYLRGASLPGRLGLEAATGAVEVAFSAKGPLLDRIERGEELRCEVSFTGGPLAESRVAAVSVRTASGQVAVLEVMYPISMAPDADELSQTMVASMESLRP